MQEFGAYLRNAREDKGISLEYVAEVTRIRRQYLEAMERGDFRSLPGDFYARSFLRHYADAVGLSKAEVIERYSSHRAAVAGDRNPAKRRRRHKRGEVVPTPDRVSLWRWVLVAAILLGVAFYLRGFDQGPGTTGHERPSLNTEIRGDERSENSVEIRPDTPPAPAPAGEVLGDTPQPVEEPVPDMAPPGAGKASQPEPAPGESSPIGTERFTEVLAPVRQEVLLELTVSLRGQCWFQVFSDGKEVFSGLLDRGDTAVWIAADELRVKFGRPEVVDLELNGVDLGTAGTGVLTRTFTWESLQ